MKEIHVVGIGSSFNLNMLKKINGPVFLVSFWAPLHQDERGNIIYSSDLGISKQIGKDHINKKVKLKECKEIKNENYKYVHARKEIIEFFKNKGHKILSIEPYGVDKDQNYFSFYKETKTNEYLNLFKDKQCIRVEVVEKFLNHLYYPLTSLGANRIFFTCNMCIIKFCRKSSCLRLGFFFGFLT